MQQLLAAPYTAKLTRAYPRDMRENIHTEFLTDIPKRERERKADGVCEKARERLLWLQQIYAPPAVPELPLRGDSLLADFELVPCAMSKQTNNHEQVHILHIYITYLNYTLHYAAHRMVYLASLAYLVCIVWNI